MARLSTHMLLCLMAAATLAGCADKWQKPGATPAQLQADQAICNARGQWRYPPLMQSILVAPGYSTPPVTRCYTNSSGVTQCYTSPGIWQPPIFSEVDADGGARVRDVRECMIEKGWRIATK